MTVSESKVFVVSKRFLAVGWLVSALAISYWLWSFSRHPATSILATLFFGLFFSAAPLFFITRTPRLDISHEGLALIDFARSLFVRWDEIKNIRLGWIGTGSAQWASNKNLFVNYRRDGADVMMVIRPLFFGVKADDLVLDIIPFCHDEDVVATMLSDREKGIQL